MTDRELMQQAADKLSIMVGYPGLRLYHEDIRAVLTSLQERLAQPQRTHWEGCGEVHPECKQPRREWVGLTEEELEAVDKTIDKFVPLPEAKRLYARAIEAKLLEKNA